MSIHLSRNELAGLGIAIDEPPAVGVAYPSGPWLHSLIVAIDTPVRSKSNYRRGRGGQRWGQVVEFESRLREALRWARPNDWPLEEKEVALKERHGIVGSVYARALLDTSNLSKSVYDAGEGVLYFNDAQVRAESSFLDRQRQHNLLICGFATVEPGTDSVQAHTALTALNMAVLHVVQFVAGVDRLP